MQHETLMQPPAIMRFAGYAALFNVVDRGGDIIRPGAFDRSLAAKASLPLLWQHRALAVIGSVDQLAQDARGLRVIASISGGSADAKEAAKLLKAAAAKGLSFGYRVRQSRGQSPRELLEIDLVEISLVTIPMQPRAQVHAAIRNS